MSEDDNWSEARGRVEEKFARFDDRVARIEKALERISDNSVWLIRLGVAALVTLAGHALVSYIQMSAP